MVRRIFLWQYLTASLPLDVDSSDILEKVKLKKTESVVNCYYSKFLTVLEVFVKGYIIVWE